MTRAWAKNNIFSILDFKECKTRKQCKTAVDKDTHFTTTYFDQHCDVFAVQGAMLLADGVWILFILFPVQPSLTNVKNTKSVVWL